MTRLVLIPWLLLALWLLLYALRVAIADLAERGRQHRGRSWGECCLDSRSGITCDCLPVAT